jgi:hypothetical protein
LNTPQNRNERSYKRTDDDLTHCKCMKNHAAGFSRFQGLQFGRGAGSYQSDRGISMPKAGHKTPNMTAAYRSCHGTLPRAACTKVTIDIPKKHAPRVRVFDGIRTPAFRHSSYWPLDRNSWWSWRREAGRHVHPTFATVFIGQQAVGKPDPAPVSPNEAELIRDPWIGVTTILIDGFPSGPSVYNESSVCK